MYENYIQLRVENQATRVRLRAILESFGAVIQYVKGKSPYTEDFAFLVYNTKNKRGVFKFKHTEHIPAVLVNQDYLDSLRLLPSQEAKYIFITGVEP